ncbi:MAG TPA: SPOR domain-containing protein [Ramlibacter sp.]|uniref:SPOR domain-containing protein n=1 Tax=Ramlibacter sp. TaxID=1917967 RepID=UPI002CCFE1E1|nr:SPOR domain-containing protein [Ramlibacter sp.]HVZ46165.1 SPOR domain-containing protein [Ramlibacter sp.]
MNKVRQGGNVIVGIIIGVVLGLAAALAVAVYVTKVPVPFLNKGGGRTAEQDAAESRKNQNWDPNAPLYGKNPAHPVTPASGAAGAGGGIGGGAGGAVGAASAAPAASARSATNDARPNLEARPPAVVGGVPPGVKSGDPLGDLAAARTGALGPGGDPFFYFVQAGAFRTPEDAEAQRAKLSLMGIEAKVTEREQSGRQVYRVRVGPFDKKEDADRQKDKLDSGGFETALVRVQR